MAEVTGITAKDIAILEKAIASGAKKVKYSADNEVEYRDLSEMLKTLEIMKAKLNEGDPSQNNNRIAYTSYKR